MAWYLMLAEDKRIPQKAAAADEISAATLRYLR